MHAAPIEFYQPAIQVAQPCAEHAARITGTYSTTNIDTAARCLGYDQSVWNSGCHVLDGRGPQAPGSLGSPFLVTFEECFTLLEEIIL